MDLKKMYSSELSKVLETMENSILKDNPSNNIIPEYFILAVLECRDCYGYKILDECLSSENLSLLRQFYFDFLRQKSLTAVSGIIKNNPVYGEELQFFIQDADEQRRKTGAKTITTEHILLSILNKSTNSIAQMLKGTGVEYKMFFDRVKNNVTERILGSSPKQVSSNTNKKQNEQSKMALVTPNSNPFKARKAKTNNIDAYCVNLNKLSSQGKIDKIVGRQSEIQQIVKVLGRRKKNNAVLIGNSGVGKTSLVQGLADMIQKGEVPSSLLRKQIISLDITAMLVGTQYRGMFEERIKGLFDELKNNKDYILFIDDIHSIINEKNGLGDVSIAGMLNNSLSEGDVQVIGATTFKEYHNSFDNNPSIARRFQKIVINPASVSESINILENIKEYYENFHNVTYTSQALKACAELANKYINERNLPDSAIDIMDEAGSNVINSIKEPIELINLRKELNELKNDKKNATKQDNYKLVDKIIEKENKLKIKINELENEFKNSLYKDKIVIDTDTIYNIVSETTGIPSSKLSSDEKKKIAHIDEVLKQTIIGQDEAIETVCKSIKRSRVGLSNINKPVSFMLIGPSGVGKTLLAKKLAKEIFGDEKYLIRLDMSEYSEKASVSKLIGASPGYIGYENGGQLTEMIKNKKYCVLLLDEIEKADNEIYNIFLQVLDEGSLTDNTGQRVDFKNVIILLTSNVGAREASERGKSVGFISDDNVNKKNIIKQELKKKFPPEFINRLDDIIYFNSLSDLDLEKIIDLELNNLATRIRNINHDLIFDHDTIIYLLNIVKEQKEYGARPILRTIQDEIENQITDSILNNDYQSHEFIVKVKDDKLVVE
jgi:ATP-dependent Clp protease ATP-binding subunit ClpC